MMFGMVGTFVMAYVTYVAYAVVLTLAYSVSSRIFFSSGGKQMTLDYRFYFYAQHNPHFY